eukprot:TRINITY_DN13815_c0_g1_i1.p1 TRINITY_DN13815_c0_g1~~TRINITY_DN13815_c0_g1_i1.p1  ORF type:complete len:365 (+),score=145.36 TRINITY_DN13815_c0_g1_i1:51-1097(+)
MQSLLTPSGAANASAAVFLTNVALAAVGYCESRQTVLLFGFTALLARLYKLEDDVAALRRELRARTPQPVVQAKLAGEAAARIVAARRSVPPTPVSRSLPAPADAPAAAPHAAQSAAANEDASIREAERLHDDGKYRALHTYLSDPRRTRTDSDWLWRRSRAAYNMSQQPGVGAEVKKSLVMESLEMARAAVAAGNHCAKSHCWLGIALSAAGEIQGTKAKIASLMDMKAAWKRAVELDPTDATSLNLLGRWCMGIVNTTWVERRAAAVLFGSLPETSVEEALSYFRLAEEVSPGGYKNNQLMLGKCYANLGQKAEAKKWLESSLRIPLGTEEDKRDHAAAEEMLRGM